VGVGGRKLLLSVLFFLSQEAKTAIKAFSLTLEYNVPNKVKNVKFIDISMATVDECFTAYKKTTTHYILINTYSLH